MKPQIGLCLNVPKQPTCMNASHCPEREIIGHVTFQRPHTWLFSVRGKEAGRLSGSFRRVVFRLNRRLVVSSAAQCVNYRAESLAMRTESRERGPALLTCTDEEGGTSCRRKNWGDDLFRRLDVRARSRPFFARARARPGTVYGPTCW